MTYLLDTIDQDQSGCEITMRACKDRQSIMLEFANRGDEEGIAMELRCLDAMALAAALMKAVLAVGVCEVSDPELLQ